jgi:predicted Zn-dependent peptidase
VINGELALLQVAGLSNDELALGKQQLKGQITLSMESVSSRMYRAAAVDLFDEPYRPLDETLARVDAITAGDVQSVCRDFFGVEHQTVMKLGPAA